MGRYSLYNNVNHQMLKELKEIGDLAFDDDNRQESWSHIRARYWRLRVDDCLAKHHAPMGLVFAQASDKAWAYEPDKKEFLTELARLITTLSAPTPNPDYGYSAIINTNPVPTIGPAYGGSGITPDMLKIPQPVVTISKQESGNGTGGIAGEYGDNFT